MNTRVAAKFGTSITSLPVRGTGKVGRKSDAIKLYQIRKADATAGRKLPELRNSRALTVSELIDDVLEYVADHKDRLNYISKAEIVRAALGSTPATHSALSTGFRVTSHRHSLKPPEQPPRKKGHSPLGELFVT
jgi:hypothetical protein